MTAESFETCLTEAALDISLDPDVHVHSPDANDYLFGEKKRFLYAYLISKLSTDLHDRVSSIEGKNGC